MKLANVIDLAIEPAYLILPDRMRSPAATTMLLAIGLQESRFEYRRQVRGPARGFWQFESRGGVAGVMTHHASHDTAAAVALALQYPIRRDTIYEALADNDVLAAAFARLLLWTDPVALPEDADSAWAYYLRIWRPGRPHPETWARCWARATNEVQS